MPTFRIEALKTSMNSRPMTLRLRSGSVTPLSFVEEAPRGVDEHHLQVQPLREAAPDLGRLVLAQQPVVDEHAGETVADRTVDEQGRHRRVDAPGERADDPPLAPPAPRICSTDSSTKEAAFQSRRQPHTSRKLASTFVPSSVWTTSGWKRMPKSRRSRASIAGDGVASRSRRPR